MIYNIDGLDVEVDINSDVFMNGYEDGIDHAVFHKGEDLGLLHDQNSNNPYCKNSHDWRVFKAGFIQGAS